MPPREGRVGLPNMKSNDLTGSLPDEKISVLRWPAMSHRFRTAHFFGCLFLR